LQHPQQFLAVAHRPALDAEPLGRVARRDRRRQQLRRQRPQQMRLAVEQGRKPLGTERPGKQVGDAPPRVRDAARPAPRIAGMAPREAAAGLAPCVVSGAPALSRGRGYARGRTERNRIRSK
jgi:hypothetical protein